MLKKKFYDATKFVAQIALPAAGTAYFAFAGIWNLPNAEQVVGSITVVDTFLGALLGISSIQYNASDAKYDGTVTAVTPPDGSKITYQLELNGNPEDLASKSDVTFKVVPVTVDPTQTSPPLDT
jgi:hypothetical protein